MTVSGSWIYIIVYTIILFPVSGEAKLPQQSSGQSPDSMLAIVEPLPVKAQVDSLLNYARFFQSSNPALSSRLVEHARALAESTGDPLLTSNTLNAGAIMNFYLGNDREAARLIMQSIDLVEKARRNFPDSVYLAQRLMVLYGNAGNIYQAMGMMDSALRALLSSLRLSDTLMTAEPGNLSLLTTRINMLNNTAVVYQSLQKTGKAEQLLAEALQLGREINTPPVLLPTLNNIGLIRIDQQRYDEAISTFNEALNLGRLAADSMGVSGNLNNLGLIYERLGNLPKARSYYLASLAITQRLGFSIGIANTCANLGRIYSELNMPDSAVFYANAGIDEALRSGNDTYLMKNYETLTSIYEKTGNYALALKMEKKFVGVKDSIFNAGKNRQIEEMTARYETEKKENENRLLRKNIEIRQRTEWLLIISLAAIVLIALLLYYFYRLKNKALKQEAMLREQQQELHRLETDRLEDQLFAEQQINKLQSEKIEQKNRELSTRMLHAINKNDAMNAIIHQLDLCSDNTNTNTAPCYEKIRQIAHDNLSLDKDWEQFKLHFEEVNPGFFHQLREQYPTLTENELKLCAYYRINLGTKEIARILNVTPSAIQKSRYRLRKKMQIPSDVELPNFMSNI